MLDINEIFELNKNKEKAAQFIVDLLENTDFSIKHPTLKTPTYPRSSKRKGVFNIIHFSDENLSNHWFFLQATRLIDAYIIGGEVFNPYKKGGGEMIVKLIQTKELTFNLNMQSSGFNGLIFSHPRPFHFFYDQFVNYFRLSKLKDIDDFCFTDNQCFYGEVSTAVLKKADNLGCYLFPSIGGDSYIQKLRCTDSVAIKSNQFLKNNAPKKEIKSDFILWLGITNQKRSWLDQVEGYVSIIKKIAQSYSKVTVLIDGWTNHINDHSINKEDHEIYQQINERIIEKTNVTLINLINKDYKTKISYGNEIDYFIANSGTGCLIPFMICNKKGVIHSNGKLHTFSNAYNENVRLVPNDKIIAEKSQMLDANSYSIAWEVIYNLLMELVGNDERLQEGLPTFKSKLIFSELQFSDKTDPADALRDIALLFDEIGDRKTAYKIMSKALEQRPDGSLIKQKIKEWK